MANSQVQAMAAPQDLAAENTKPRRDTYSLQFFFDQAAGYLNTVWREILTGLHSFLAARV